MDGDQGGHCYGCLRPRPRGVKDLKITRREFKGKADELSFIIGHVTKTVENFQGHHLPHDIPRVLAVFDECSAIGDEFHTASESWAHRILNIGNPMNTTNYFYRTVKEGNVADPAGHEGLLSNVIHISGEDSPNVQVGKYRVERGIPGPHPNIIPGVLAYDEWVRRMHKWDKIKRRIRLEGLFYTGTEALVYPPDWLDAAEKSFRILCNGERFEIIERRPGRLGSVLAMGVDCGAGRDLSVWTVIDRQGLVFQYETPTPDTYEITQLTIKFIEMFDIAHNRVCFDAGGGGRQVVDHMRPLGYRGLRSVGFGTSPTPPPATKNKSKDKKVNAKEVQWTYKNKRAEMYGILRQWMDPSVNQLPFAIPEELYELRHELSIMPMWFDKEGKMFLPPKDKMPGTRENPNEITIKKLLGRSPDRADSLVLATYALAVRGKTVVGALRKKGR